jgi:hypothetical protein
LIVLFGLHAQWANQFFVQEAVADDKTQLVVRLILLKFGLENVD